MSLRLPQRSGTPGQELGAESLHLRSPRAEGALRSPFAPFASFAGPRFGTTIHFLAPASLETPRRKGSGPKPSWFVVSLRLGVFARESGLSPMPPARRGRLALPTPTSHLRALARPLRPSRDPRFDRQLIASAPAARTRKRTRNENDLDPASSLGLSPSDTAVGGRAKVIDRALPAPNATPARRRRASRRT